MTSLSGRKTTFASRALPGGPDAANSGNASLGRATVDPDQSEKRIP
jgi:hypothetical protein